MGEVPRAGDGGGSQVDALGHGVTLVHDEGGSCADADRAGLREHAFGAAVAELQGAAVDHGGTGEAVGGGERQGAGVGGVQGEAGVSTDAAGAAEGVAPGGAVHDHGSRGNRGVQRDNGISDDPGGITEEDGVKGVEEGGAGQVAIDPIGRCRVPGAVAGVPGNRAALGVGGHREEQGFANDTERALKPRVEHGGEGGAVDRPVSYPSHQRIALARSQRGEIGAFDHQAEPGADGEIVHIDGGHGGAWAGGAVIHRKDRVAAKRKVSEVEEATIGRHDQNSQGRPAAHADVRYPGTGGREQQGACGDLGRTGVGVDPGEGEGVCARFGERQISFQNPGEGGGGRHRVEGEGGKRDG